MSFDACQTATSMGAVDIALSGFSWKEDRAANYNLSDNYHTGDPDEHILITFKENEGKYATVDSLEGLKVGAQIASLQEALVKQNLPDSELVVVTDLTTAIMQLRNGGFVALAVHTGNAEAILANNDDLVKSGLILECDDKYKGNVVLLKKGNDALTEKVNELLAKAESEGLYSKWYAEAKSISVIEVFYDDGNEIKPESSDVGSSD